MTAQKLLTIILVLSLLATIAYLANRQGEKNIQERVMNWAAQENLTVLGFNEVNPLTGTYPGPRLWWKGAWLVYVEARNASGEEIKGWLIPGNPFTAPSVRFFKD